MRVPSVHLNGTSKDELIRQLEEAGLAIRDAIEKLQGAAPHGRDYYVQDTTTKENAYREAAEEHRSRLVRMKSVLEEVVLIHERLVIDGGSDRRTSE